MIKMQGCRNTWIASLITMSCVWQCWALELGAPFRDNAILQRDMNIPVWGWSMPGDTITVTFAGQSQQAEVAKDGKWTVTLDPLKASFAPKELSVQVSGVRTGPSSIGNRQLSITNILVGEVWMASGQSNMQWKRKDSSCALLTVPVDAAIHVNPIREFEVTSVYAMPHPIKHATGEWKDGNYDDYSAIAFAFAQKLYTELKVPIGILNCSFSQTQIQAWVPREGFASGTDAYTKDHYLRCLQTDPFTPEHQQAWEGYYQAVESALADGKAIPVRVPGNIAHNRDSTWLFNGRMSPVVPYAIRGAIWNQGYANKDEGMPYYNNLHSMIRGWRMVWNRPELPVYFHQFYTPGNDKPNWKPVMDGTSEMRLGTWLARYIPNTGMASQIDIQGAIHYRNKAVPGQRLALHALKNQYGKSDLIVDGPMFKSYLVTGDKVIVSFSHADGGLVVAETGKNANASPSPDHAKSGFAIPEIIAKGDRMVTLFSLAGPDRIWHPATCDIAGQTVVVRSPEVKEPRGVAYGTAGIGFQPNLYNQALLPMTPFMHYDHELVTSDTWPDEVLKIVGDPIEPEDAGLLREYSKMPILAPQFVDNAVLQADKPITVWGSLNKYGDYGGPLEADGTLEFIFGDFRQTIEVGPGMEEWQITLPPMKATFSPRPLTVRLLVNGELATERICHGIVIGEVWYVAGAAPFDRRENKDMLKNNDELQAGAKVRMLCNESKRSSSPNPARFSPSVSATPDSSFTSVWRNPVGFAEVLGNAIYQKTGAPVGIIFMQRDSSKGARRPDPELKSWIYYDYLKQAPSLVEDYADVAARYPGTPFYRSAVKAYLEEWRDYWGTYIPAMMKTGSVPDGAAWGIFPEFGSTTTSTASEHYNVLVHSFTPIALRGVLFLTYPMAVESGEGRFFGEQMSALGNSFIGRFGGDPVFCYTTPTKVLAPNITVPSAIEGVSHGITISDWSDMENVITNVLQRVYERGND